MDDGDPGLSTRPGTHPDADGNNSKEYPEIKYTKREYHIDAVLLDHFFRNLIRYKDTPIAQYLSKADRIRAVIVVQGLGPAEIDKIKISLQDSLLGQPDFPKVCAGLGTRLRSFRAGPTSRRKAPEREDNPDTNPDDADLPSSPL